MDDTNFMTDFLMKLLKYLLGRNATHDDLSIFRKHSNKLDTHGEVSFPLALSAWTSHLHENTKDPAPILALVAACTRERAIDNLVNCSKSWKVTVVKCVVRDEKQLCVFLNRTNLFRLSIEQVLLTGDGHKLNLPHPPLHFRTDCGEKHLSEMDLTQLRINLLKNVACNLQKFNGCDGPQEAAEVVYLTNKSKSNFDRKIVCGVVIAEKFGKKNTDVSAEEFYRRRTVDMRLMAQHKYGVRVNSEAGWREFFEKLGSAAVTFDLLHVKPSKTLVINVDNPVSSSSKGASFILYNFARISEIFKKFEKKVESGCYPALPAIDQADFGLLTQPEEWEIVYVYLMRYEDVLESCVQHLLKDKLTTHNLCIFAAGLCSLFSVYYRRVRILTDARLHLIPLLHSRIYLLKSVQQVLQNVLSLLGITPVRQM